MNFELLFQKAKAAGVEDVQVYLVSRNELSIEVFEGVLDKYEIADTTSLTVKGVFNKKMGTYMSEIVNESVFDDIIVKIIASAKIIDSPDDAIIYAGDPHYEKLEGLFNESLKNLDVAKKIAAVKELDALFHKSSPLIVNAETMYSESTRSVLLQNTKGLKLYNKVNSAMIGGSIIAKNAEDQRTGFDLLISNEWVDFQLAKLANEIVKSGVDMLGAKPIPSGEYEIVLDRVALATIVSAFSNVFSAEAVQKNMSLLKGKIGQTIGSSLVTIFDDPFMKKSSSSRSFDDEGVATRQSMMVQNGVLKTYLHNLNTSKKDGVASTGNGFGGAVSAVNLNILPGKFTQDELVATMQKGILVTEVQGAHAGANPISGDFSLQASGFLVENGKIVKPVALITVASNFLKMLSDVCAIGNDLKTGYYGITCPSIKITKMNVSGI